MKKSLQHKLFEEAFSVHASLTLATRRAMLQKTVEVIELCAQRLRDGGKLIFVGNGGSAADSQHLAAEFVVRLKCDRRAIAAIALTTDSSILTAAGNDYGYDRIFDRQLDAIGRSGDVLIAISTSGNSKNILNAAELAKMKRINVVGLTGDSGGELSQLSDVTLNVPADDTARIQEMHILLGHIICRGIEVALLENESSAAQKV